MKKTIFIFIVIIVLLVYPNIVKAEVIEITQEDFDEIIESAVCDEEEYEGNYCEVTKTIKGIRYKKYVGLDFENDKCYIEGNNYKLGSDINLNASITFSNENMIIDLNNHSIESNSFDGIELSDNSSLTINGDGNISGGLFGFTIGNNSEVIINNQASVIGGLLGISCGDNSILIINGNASVIGLAYSIVSSSELQIYNGTFFGIYGLGVSQSGIAHIYGGNIMGYSVSAMFEKINNADISGGSFKIIDEESVVEFLSNYYVSSSDVSNQIENNDISILGAIAVVYEDEMLSFDGLLRNNYIFNKQLTYDVKDSFEVLLTNNQTNVQYSKQEEVSVIQSNVEYEIIEGENQKYNDSDIIIKSNGDYSLFQKLLVDEEEVDSSNYIVESGSTIVTLKKEFIDTLDEGNHTVTFVYVNGQVSTTLTINNTAVDTPQVTNNPGTLDSIYYYLMIFICSIIMLIICKKKAIKNF